MYTNTELLYTYVNFRIVIFHTLNIDFPYTKLNLKLFTKMCKSVKELA